MGRNNIKEKSSHRNPMPVLNLFSLIMILPGIIFWIIIILDSGIGSPLFYPGVIAISVSLLAWFFSRIILRKSFRRILNLFLTLSPDKTSGNIHKKYSNIFLEGRNNYDYLNNSIKQLKSDLEMETEELSEQTENLFILTSELSGENREQNSSLDEMVSTMEDSDSMNKRIADSLIEINRISQNMKDSFLTGFDLIKESLVKMDEIASSNKETLSGIQFLGTKIENIWEIVNIINGIADQTKIIAFNAELEASAAGEAGKNFQIVASEIRRLADSTVDSTNEIKTRINEIQHSSDTLIISSEQGTERIKEGSRLSEELQSVFNDVLHLTEITAGSTDEIRESIELQVKSFRQILDGLRKISFTMSKNAASGKQIRENHKQIEQLIRKIGHKIQNLTNQENKGEQDERTGNRSK